MRQFFSFILKEARHILRDKRTMLVLFGMPVAMMLLFGFAISTDVRNVRTVVVTSSIDHQTQRSLEALAASEYFQIVEAVSSPKEAERLIRAQKADMAVVFTADYASKHEGFQLITDGADPNMAQQYANYATQILGGEASGASISLLFNPQMRSCYNFVPGIMGMLLMLVCAMMTSISIVREKERGTMEVLLVSPIRPILIIIAKAVPYLVLAFVILIAILLMSKYILGVPLEGSILLILLISTIYILLALSLGLLISTLVNSQLAALLISAMVLLMPCVLLSGMIFPIESMPTILQYISALMPPRYFISAMRKLMIVGTDFNAVTSEALILLGMALLLLILALRNFKQRLA